MCMFGIKRFSFSFCFSFIFFDQVFWSNRSRAKLIIKFASLLLKIKLYAKEAGSAKGFRSLINGLNMAAYGIFSFINTKNGLEACCAFHKHFVICRYSLWNMKAFKISIPGKFIFFIQQQHSL